MNKRTNLILVIGWFICMVCDIFILFNQQTALRYGALLASFTLFSIYLYSYIKKKED